MQLHDVEPGKRFTCQALPSLTLAPLGGYMVCQKWVVHVFEWVARATTALSAGDAFGINRFGDTEQRINTLAF